MPTDVSTYHQNWSARLRTAGAGLVMAGIAAFAAIGQGSQAQAGWTVLDPDGGQERYVGRTSRQSESVAGSESAPRASGRRRAQRAVESDDEAVSRPRRAQRTRNARVRNSDDDNSGGYSAKPKVSGGHVSWVASGGCLPGSLRSVISDVSQYGRVVVSSTGRNHSHNRSVGGAQQSYHLSCQAADFRVHGNVASAASYLRNHSSVGGFHHYGGGLFHVDTGPKRTW